MILRETETCRNGLFTCVSADQVSHLESMEPAEGAHVMAIAWMYRSDYDRAGYAVLPAGKRGTTLMIWQMMAPLILLLPLTLVPVVVGRAGLHYLAAALLLGAWFAYRADRLAVQPSNATARRVLLASIVYLPLLFACLIADQV